MDYIAVVLQDSNFQNRCALIPADAFLEARGAEWANLKVNCETASVEGTQVDNVVWDNLVWEGGFGYHAQTSYWPVLKLLYDAIEWRDQRCAVADREWIKGIISPIRSTFDCVADYQRLCAVTQYKGKQIRIVDSVCKLERHNNEYTAPVFKTVYDLLEWNKEN